MRKNPGILTSPTCYESSSQEAFITFKQWILGLQSIWFIHLLDADSRLGFGPLSGTRNHTILGLNSAMPIFPYGTDFELFTPDPPHDQSNQGSMVKQTGMTLSAPFLHGWRWRRGLALAVTRVVEVTRNPPAKYPTFLQCGGGGGGGTVVGDAWCPAMWRTSRPWMNVYSQSKTGVTSFLLTALSSLILPQFGRRRKNGRRAFYQQQGSGSFHGVPLILWMKSLPSKAYQNLRGQRPGLGLFDLENDGGD